MSLNNLGAILRDLGRREDALAAAQEGTDLYRRLAAERPDVFRPDLAMSLDNLGGTLSASVGARTPSPPRRRGPTSIAASPPNGPTPSAPISPCRSTISAVR
jgi:hypothetical protein